MEKKFAITIARQYGSGGLMIAERLSHILNIPFYDKALIQLASKKSKLGESLFEKADEYKKFLAAELFEDVFNANPILDDSLFKIQSDVIKQIARKESAIFVGRCADYVLREHFNCISIFISANIEERIKRVSLRSNISHEKAEKLIYHTDKERAKYYNYYTQKIWSIAQSYNLCINSSVLGIDETASFIRYFIEKKFK
ncbi:MAG: cytidylate kinase-like family protein [Endomicrobium sp.]|nr:cytidylate kinase-like family protein [Endomicrobium sp.]